jgi:hypothetical protein
MQITEVNAATGQTIYTPPHRMFGVFTYRVPPMVVTLQGTQERYSIA